ncbi:MAG: sugar phosphate nucleotidyltransferase [Patescibacteria group bacterium]|nr:sugar phosphate nucleotidyltransferase [Patescibacteria group bacterium]
MHNFSKITAIVLAAGRGTRMNTDHPKVLHEINGQPIIKYTLEKLDCLNLGKIIIVVGYEARKIQTALEGTRVYAKQSTLLGTADAVKKAMTQVSFACKTILVINGDDSAFYKVETLKSIINQHLDSKAKMTILTSIQDQAEISGRVIRNKQGGVISIKPNSQMTAKELKINKEVVCGLYLFDITWLRQHLPKIEPGKKGEYNITALIDTALGEGTLQDIKLADPNEWKSINTQQELQNAQKLWKKLYG